MENTVEKAYEMAKIARARAYCPHSKYQVGAAVKAQGSDQLYYGCNVENASFGATVCAERNAIFSMVANEGHVELEFVVLVTDNEQGAAPCGMCLQVISEFCQPDMPVYIYNLKGLQKTLLFGEYLPQPFNAESF